MGVYMETKGEKIFGIFNYVIMSMLMIATAYPLLYVLFASFSEPGLIIQHRGILMKPLGFSIKAYHEGFKNSSIRSG